MGFELTWRSWSLCFCGFGVARSAGMETLRHPKRALQLHSEGSGCDRADVERRHTSRERVEQRTVMADSGSDQDVNKDFLPQQFLSGSGER